MRLLVGIPTANSAGHIGSFLPELAQEMRRTKQAVTDVDALFVINNTSDDTERELLRGSGLFDGHKIDILNIGQTKVCGKIEPMSAIADYAIAHGYEIIAFVDDDVSFKGSSLLSAVKLLRSNEKASLVGLPLVSLPCRFNLKKPWESVVRKTFGVPYQSDPKLFSPFEFAVGATMVTWTRAFPRETFGQIAEMRLLVSEDTLLNGLFGRERTVIAQDGAVRYRPMGKLAEWWKRSPRMKKGRENALACLPPDQKEGLMSATLRKTLVANLIGSGPYTWLCFALNRTLLAADSFIYENFRKGRTDISWAGAASTKKGI